MARTNKQVKVVSTDNTSAPVVNTNAPLGLQTNSGLTVPFTAPANGMAAMANMLGNNPPAIVAANKPIPHSVTVLQNLQAGKLAPAASLGKWASHANSTLCLTKQGAASPQLAARLNSNAKNGPCPFLQALYAGAQRGQTLAQAWAQCASIAGHGQQGRGMGGYTAASALTYYLGGKWFTLQG
jgi:hypothetical protein